MAVSTEFLHEQAFRLVMSHIIIALMAAIAFGAAQFFPAVGPIDRAAKVLGINKGFHHQDRMSIMQSQEAESPLWTLLRSGLLDVQWFT